MADDSGEDKTEDPTGKRLSESRRKGQVVRSRELNSFITLMVSVSLFMSMGHSMTQDLLHMMQMPLRASREQIFDPVSMLQFLQQCLFSGLSVVLPLSLILLVLDIASPIILGGWNFTSEAFEFNFDKLNPLNGIKRIFGIQGVIELLKAVLKVAIVGFVAWILFKTHIRELMSLSAMPVDEGIHRAAEILVHSVLLLCATLAIVVAVDVPYQIWHMQQQLKMTKQEVRDEAKEMEGNPQVKTKIRQLQMQAAQRRMMEAVPSADVIVTNPTHYAVALKYDPEGNGAPIVVAKGVDLIAAQIRHLAMGNHVPLVAAPQLARALYYSTDLDREIPRGLFLAVAQVLAYVFQLRAATQGVAYKPKPPGDLDVPEEFRY
jgi:flagellar biosynthesis protein FlhB